MIGVSLYMKKELDYFKIGIGWALLASIVMLVGTLKYDKYPQIFEYLYNNLGIVAASSIYIIANFIIFTFPAFLVYKAGELSNRQKKIATNNKFLTIFRKTVFFIKHVIPITIFFLALYLIAAGIRGDIFTNSLHELTDYGYCIGVIVTAMLFGFGDLKDVEDTQQNHDLELKKMEDSYTILEAKYKQIKKRYSTLESKNKEMEIRFNELRNKGKRELAKLEKNNQLEASQVCIDKTLVKK